MEDRKKLVIQAKEKMGEDAAFIIARDLQLEKFDDKNLKGLCPFHDEDTGSFIWNPNDNCYKCFGCGRNYGIIDHYMNFYHLTYIESLKKLFEITGVQYRFSEQELRDRIAELEAQLESAQHGLQSWMNECSRANAERNATQSANLELRAQLDELQRFYAHSQNDFWAAREMIDELSKSYRRVADQLLTTLRANIGG